MFHLLGYEHFTLLYFGFEQGRSQADPLLEAVAVRAVPLKLQVIDEPALAFVYKKAFVLVRPDQHVCWRGNQLPDDCQELVETIRGAATA